MLFYANCFTVSCKWSNSVPLLFHCMNFLWIWERGRHTKLLKLDGFHFSHFHLLMFSLQNWPQGKCRGPILICDSTLWKCSLEVDLSKELTAPSGSVEEPQVEEQVQILTIRSLCLYVFWSCALSFHTHYNKIMYRLLWWLVQNGEQPQHDVSKKSGRERQRLQLEAAYVIFVSID